jgi:hypothetical protein
LDRWLLQTSCTVVSLQRSLCDTPPLMNWLLAVHRTVLSIDSDSDHSSCRSHYRTGQRGQSWEHAGWGHDVVCSCALTAFDPTTAGRPFANALFMSSVVMGSVTKCSQYMGLSRMHVQNMGPQYCHNPALCTESRQLHSSEP